MQCIRFKKKNTPKLFSYTNRSSKWYYWNNRYSGYPIQRKYFYPFENAIINGSYNSSDSPHAGLHLTLFTEQPEYVGLFAQEAGVRVAIHPPNVFPFPEDDGVVASTGQATDIGLRQVSRERRSEREEGEGGIEREF